MVEDDCNIWDEGDDYETNIRFDKKRPGVVVGASFNKLIERITSVTDHGETTPTIVHNYHEQFRHEQRCILYQLKV